MYRNEYARFGLSRLNLSRTLEDSATLTSVLIPWNTCGAYMSATLGVATFSYAPYTFFNLLCPLVAIAYGYLNFALKPVEQSHESIVEAGQHERPLCTAGQAALVSNDRIFGGSWMFPASDQ